MGKRTELECPFVHRKQGLGTRMGKRIELGMPVRPSKARPWDKDGKTYRIGNAYSSIESKALGLGWENVPNWECLFVHRKQGLGTRMGKRTELGMPIRPSKARPWD